MPNSAAFKDAQQQAAQTWVTLGHDTLAEDRPDYENDLCQRQKADVEMMRELYGGTSVLRSKGEKYLPRLSDKEQDKDYERRLKMARYWNAVRRTVRGLNGMIFSSEPITENVPDVIVEDLENVDLTGRDLAVFARNIGHDALLDGHAIILVEHPPALRVETAAGERPANLLEERSAGVRPYWVQIKKSAVINVQWEERAGEPHLTLFVYRESTTEKSGTFGERCVERYRVLRPGSFEVWQEDRDANNRVTFRLVDQGTTSLDYIPVVPVYAEQVGFWESVPPLLDLGYESIGHYQSRNEHEQSLRRARVPMPFFRGIEPESVKWGPNYAIFSESPEGEATMLETTGAALSASSQDVKDHEMRMATLGLSMLVRETRAAETAEGKRIDRSESDSQLATIAGNIGDALSLALWYSADYRKIDRENAGSIRVNTDFADDTLDAQTMGAYTALVKAGFPRRVVLEALQQGGRIDEDADLDELELEWLANEAAAERQAQLEAEMREQQGPGPELEAA